MLNYKQTAETFTIGFSVNKIIFIVSFHLLALLASWQNGLSVEIRANLVVILLVSLFIQLSDYNSYYKQLRFKEQSGWELAWRGAGFVPISMEKDSVVTSWLLIIYCLVGQKQRVIVVFNDALPAREYRKLLVLVKTSGL